MGKQKQTRQPGYVTHKSISSKSNGLRAKSIGNYNNGMTCSRVIQTEFVILSTFVFIESFPNIIFDLFHEKNKPYYLLRGAMQHLRRTENNIFRLRKKRFRSLQV